MRRLFILISTLALLAVQPVFADGFVSGAHVKAVDKLGNVFEGNIVSFIGEQSIKVTDGSSRSFFIPLNKIKSVAGVYGSDFITSTGLRLTPIKVTMADGETLDLGYTENTMFSIDMGVKGSKAVYFPAPDRWTSIESSEVPMKDKSGMIIRLKDGRVMDVDVKKEDISSIEFN